MTGVGDLGLGNHVTSICIFIMLVLLVFSYITLFRCSCFCLEFLFGKLLVQGDLVSSFPMQRQYYHIISQHIISYHIILEHVISYYHIISFSIKDPGVVSNDGIHDPNG